MKNSNSLLSGIIIIFSILLIQCNKKEAPLPDPYICTYFESLDSTFYYSNEIFSDQHLDIYGKWKLFKINGGWSGDGMDLNFDYLLTKPFGIYAIIRNDSVLTVGNIENSEQTNQFLKIELKSDSIFVENPLHETMLYADLSKSDTLLLQAGFYDGYDYHFVRE
ncbi:MAG: hypothetical protein JEZ03_13655 [Bacteroidales bacterium]|nr:hypothetical protein [Bacteroidales bacterium]